MARTELGIPDEAQLRQMRLLAARHPERATHAVDLPYRLAWASPERAWEAETALWQEDGQLAAWAVWHPGSWMLEATCEPESAEALWPEMLSWGGAQARRQAAGRDDPASWYVMARADDVERLALLEAHGFRRESWTSVQYERDLGEPVSAPNGRALDDPRASAGLPEGFVIRPLAGAREVPAYVAAHRAAFNSTRMNEAWRRRTLRVPGYDPELDLVAAAPDGRVVGFAIIWLGPAHAGRRGGNFEPVGVRPEFHRRGLGRALLVEGMRRLRAAGATHALVTTEDVRKAANALYRSVMTDSGVRTHHYVKTLD